ncbi:GlxA family transcriptional regulator [Altericroceibacterium spongiae]|uniref:GlxA family transcriptional regulator n=1 Tax=Altericroceibacterium spongiae TaxID=2320269 RepID=A0A420ELS5_9SPHN|nr:GlxA family transcriptional regulator [Altericroceibacterium spongiae]RKF21633.1 GlxA family transcriptional regulator [Altericroceibacterium spongiae]
MSIPSASAAPNIAILIYPGCQMAAVLGLTDLLLKGDEIAQDKSPGGTPPVLTVSHWRQSAETGSPAPVFHSHSQQDVHPAVVVLPPALGGPVDRALAQSYAPWLRALHKEGTVLASVCGGALLLGETGLLDGRRVTTHWIYRELMQSRFPEAQPDTDRLTIDDGDIFTAGGVMAWTDLGLQLIAKYLGPTIMMDTARMFLIDPPGREQRYYSVFSPNLSHGDKTILKLQHWLQTTGATDIDLPVLCDVSGLEERTLLRRFRKATGHTTTEYAQRLRVARAQEQLQFSKASAEQIGWEVGYQDASAFRRVFRRIVGLTPAEYRRRFAA